MKFGKIASLIVLCAALKACGRPPELMSAKFGSLQECVLAMRSKLGELEFTTDRPDKVVGSPKGSTKTFACERKETGSEGVYFSGWYTGD